MFTSKAGMEHASFVAAYEAVIKQPMAALSEAEGFTAYQEACSDHIFALAAASYQEVLPPIAVQSFFLGGI